MIKLKSNTQLTLSLDVCPRCKGPHHMPLVFIALEHPIPNGDKAPWTFYATCPVTQAPIVTRIIDEQPLLMQ